MAPLIPQPRGESPECVRGCELGDGGCKLPYMCMGGVGSRRWVSVLGGWAPRDQHWDLSQLGICRQQLQVLVSSRACNAGQGPTEAMGVGR